MGRKFRLFPLGQVGVTLTEALFAAGIVGGLSLGYLQISQQQEQSQKKIEASFEIDMLTLDMAQILSNDQACANTLGTTISNGKVLTAIKNSANEALFRSSKKYGQNVIKLASMKIQNLDTATDGFGSAEVLVTFEKTAKVIKGKRREERVIPLSIQVSPGSIACNPDGSARFVRDAHKAMCDSIGGTVNASNECVPPFIGRNCPQYVAGFDNDGNLVCGNY